MNIIRGRVGGYLFFKMRGGSKGGSVRKLFDRECYVLFKKGHSLTFLRQLERVLYFNFHLPL